MNGPDDRLPSHLARLIEAERRHPGPSDEARARTFGLIAATLGLPTGPGGPDGSDGAAGGEGAGPGDVPGLDQAASAAATKASLLATLAKPVTIIAFAAGAATGAGTYALLSTSTPTPAPTAPVVARVERPAASPEVAPPPRELLATPPDQGQGHDQGRDMTDVTTRRPKQPRPGARRDALSRSAALGEERTLLEMARTALARGRAADALKALDQHRRRFATGQLTEEREALSILALVKLGDGDHARARAARFRARYPQSFFWPAVEDALKKAD